MLILSLNLNWFLVQMEQNSKHKNAESCFKYGLLFIIGGGGGVEVMCDKMGELEILSSAKRRVLM